MPEGGMSSQTHSRMRALPPFAHEQRRGTWGRNEPPNDQGDLGRGPHEAREYAHRKEVRVAASGEIE